jgi:hypothetical protein
VLTTNGTFVTQIFHSGQPSHGGDRKPFQEMTSTQLRGTLGLVAFLLAASIKVILISLNNFRVGDFVDRIYPIELEINYTTDTDRFASYLDLHLEMDS